MGDVVSYSAFKSAKGRIDPLVADIIDALRGFGGVAHRQDVADWISSRRAAAAGRPTVLDREEVYKAFANYIAMAERRRPTPLLHTPLGADSYRWALTGAAMDLCEQGRGTQAGKAAR